MTDLTGENSYEEQWRRGQLRTVAFVDVLDFKSEVMKLVKKPDTFATVVGALQDGFSVARPLAGRPELRDFLDDQSAADLQHVFFSDCAVVSARVVPGAPDDVLRVVLGFARALLMHETGFILRGGISRGQIAHRGGLVVGPAALQAYYMEQKAAIYPRIVVADDIGRELLELENRPNRTATIRRSEDGLYFVDVLTTLGLRKGGGEVLCRARQLIVERLRQSAKVELVAKWRWLAAQYNRAVESVKEEQDDLPLPIEGTEIARLPDSM